MQLNSSSVVLSLMRRVANSPPVNLLNKFYVKNSLVVCVHLFQETLQLNIFRYKL